MKTYKVTAKRWRLGWELHIDGIGVTQSHSLADAERMVREYVVLDQDLPDEAIDSFAVEITPEIGDGLDAEILTARAQLREFEEARRAAADRSRALVRSLKAKGLSGKDIAAVLGISPQRVSQILPGKQGKVTGKHPAGVKPAAKVKEPA